jgi:hypothetical protein
MGFKDMKWIELAKDHFQRLVLISAALVLLLGQCEK